MVAEWVVVVIAAKMEVGTEVETGRAGRGMAAGAGLVGQAASVAAAEEEIPVGELGAELTAEESEGWRSSAFSIQRPVAVSRKHSRKHSGDPALGLPALGLGWRQGRGEAATTGPVCGYRGPW
jgi:hypothetical protein